MLTCHRRDVDFELKRQATAALCNLTLTSAKSSTIARSGVISALISVAKDSIDVDINCQVLAVTFALILSLWRTFIKLGI